jgi:hypothetical protein
MTDTAPRTIAPAYPSADAAMTAAKIRELNDQRMQADQEQKDRMSEIERAWASPEAKAVHEMVQQDGNVDWRDFVGHCGGILEVVAMVDAEGRPDHDRIVPQIDELFAKHYSKQQLSGFTVTRQPNNRPYRPPLRTTHPR